MSYKEKLRLKRMQDKNSRRYRVLDILCSENDVPRSKRKSYSEIGRMTGYSHTHVSNLAKKFLKCKKTRRNRVEYIV